MSDRCAPSKKYSEGSCFTFENLVEIANQFNNQHSNKIKIPSNNNKKLLLKELTSKMMNEYGCSDQACWISTPVIKHIPNEDITKYTFRPTGPKKKYAWLTTSDINKVMEQYEIKYPNFLFLGALPNDFEELALYKMNEINYTELEKTHKNLIGAVINLDTHNQSGSHWVALYINLLDHHIYYFDSFADKPGYRITSFIKKALAHMSRKNNVKKFDIYNFMNKYQKSNNYDVRYNKIQHQFKNSECGVYSMNFIIRLLEGETFDDIVNNITTDEQMNSNRQVYFRNT
jgi:hypothetical protein